ncbi:polyprenyl synthetase family protein [Bacteroides sp. 51]|uniref:polyprenyl synthetase family protein n=1 Tax=Bacteroides sp. 51 TaxID=2302938 RepID=UPI0013D318F5|nr:polyprenyl synthetase family protein [Bacteroides sp. 51]NDV82420.1 polyprenyl synthetase family protein [Bacteroides sp. 51]
MHTANQILDKINAYISGLSLIHAPEGLYTPIDYVLSMGGKRIRPVLMLMAYNLYKDDVSAALAPATGIEMYHNYTLLHDDLMDRADMRRGKKTVHKVWNDNTAILSGDAMLVLAYQYVAEAPLSSLKEMLDLFSVTALEICEGQQYDVDFEQRDDVAEQDYLEMIRLKTAVLLAASLKMGAIQGGASGQDADLLYDFGINIGLAFQLKDDFLDVYGDPAIFGKNIGGDILCNKKTYMMIKTMELANGQQKAELNKWMQTQTFNPEEKISAVIEIYNEVGIKELCENKMREYYNSAMRSLDKVSVEKETKNELINLVHELMYREN